jgi:hypothetical protein
MNYMESSRDCKHFAQSTTSVIKWLICSFVLLVACVGSAQTTPPTLGQVKLTPATPTQTAAAQASYVATNAPPGQVEKVVQVQPVRTPTKSPHRLAFKEPKTNEVTLGRHTYSGIGVQIIKAKNPLQLLNPAAPAQYGSAWDNLDQFRVSDSGPMLKLFSFSF